ncbi:MAG: OsmC family protein [Halobacteriaceae archaeon]
MHAKNALATGIEISDLSMEIHGDVDPRGVYGIDDIDSGFVNDEISYTTYIESPAPREETRRLVELSEDHCPAHSSLRKEMAFDHDIIVNGEPLE